MHKYLILCDFAELDALPQKQVPGFREEVQLLVFIELLFPYKTFYFEIATFWLCANHINLKATPKIIKLVFYFLTLLLKSKS